MICSHFRHRLHFLLLPPPLLPKPSLLFPTFKKTNYFKSIASPALWGRGPRRLRPLGRLGLNRRCEGHTIRYKRVVHHSHWSSVAEVWMYAMHNKGADQATDKRARYLSLYVSVELASEHVLSSFALTFSPRNCSFQ